MVGLATKKARKYLKLFLPQKHTEVHGNIMFKPQEFLRELGKDLVNEFEKGSYGTTPGLIGAAREVAIRNQLKKILPGVVSVGSGCVIDSYGSTSKQQDIVIYESNQCPVFSINESEDATYYPCESVIAVGEVKSTLGRRELEDSFEKIKSVKSLKRYSEDNFSWRKFGNSTGIAGADSERFDPENKTSDQVLGFIICKRFGLKPKTFLEAYRELSNGLGVHLRPNVCISLEDGIVLAIDDSGSQRTVRWDSYESTGLVFGTTGKSDFQYLLARLAWQIERGRTSSVLPFQRYVFDTNTAMSVLEYVSYE